MSINQSHLLQLLLFSAPLLVFTTYFEYTSFSKNTLRLEKINHSKTPPSTFGNLAFCFSWGLQVALLLCIGYLVSCCIPRSWGLVGMAKPWTAEAKEIHWHRPCQVTPGCLGLCYVLYQGFFSMLECVIVVLAWYQVPGCISTLELAFSTEL